ncbi:MAG: ABC transporter permease [Planctomycetota bacterium]|nr:ABC transporter permease [Planctomycetota bacterium]
MISPAFWWQAIKLALSQIRANLGRSLLTALGIIVGVASVTAVIAALGGLKDRVLTEFETFGANRLLVFPDRPDDAPRNLYPWKDVRLKIAEVDAIAEHCPSVRVVTPITSLGTSAQYGERILEGITVTGIRPAWHETENRSVLRGRPFNSIDETGARQVCLVNEDAIRELGLPADPIDEHIIIGDRRYLVVGLVETIQSTMFGINTTSAEIFIPFAMAARLQSQNFFFRATAMIRSPELAQEAESEVRFVLRKMRGLEGDEPDTFRVAAIDQFIDQFKALAAGITAIAGGIVGISLLVGGIGIMNIMLVSVSERTREIGLRKAVGATPSAVLLQFLLEAVVLCLVGGAVGVLIGEVFAIGLTFIPDAGLEQAHVPLWAIVMSFSFSAAVGVVFGMFPAIKASRLDPIEALRHE